MVQSKIKEASADMYVVTALDEVACKLYFTIKINKYFGKNKLYFQNKGY